MGLITPIEDLVLDPNKWYKVTIDAYQGGFGLTGCDMNFVNRFTCCKVGWLIQNWVDIGLECLGGAELCVVSGFTAQRLINIEGPFDDFASCIL